MGLSRNAASPATAPYVLTSAGDVRAVLNSLPLLGPPRGVSVRVPAMGDTMRLRWERRLGFWLNACGCQTGALLALSVLVWRVIIALHGPLPTWGAAAAHLGWVFAAALLGKVGGLAVARVLLVLDLTRLSRQLAIRSVVRSEVEQ